MSRNKLSRIVLLVSGLLAALVLAAGLMVVLIARSGWFRERIRAAIVEQAETATGGRVEIGSLRLDWDGLTADVDRLVIHGNEAPGQAPLLAADRVTIGLRIVSFFSRDIRLEHVAVAHPRVHIIVDAAGGTNLPRPRAPGKSRTRDVILDLKIARVEVRNGEALIESPGSQPRFYPWSGSGRNLAVTAAWDPSRDRYSGDVSFAPLLLTLRGYGPLAVNLSASAAMERNRVVVSSAVVASASSRIALSDLTIGSFAAPVVEARYDLAISAAEAARVLHWSAGGKALPLSGILNVAGGLRYVNPGDFSVSGDLRGSGLAWGSVRNVRVTGSLAGTQTKMALTGLRAALLGGEAAGSIETRGYDVYRVDGSIRGLGMRELAALGSSRPVPYDGLLSGSVSATGRLRDLPRLLDASAQLTVSPAPAGPAVHGELSARYSGPDSKIEMGHSWIELPNTRVDVSGTLGSTLAVKLESKDPDDLLPALNGHALPFTLRNGTASFSGNVSGALDDPRITGHAALTNAVYQGNMIAALSADVLASRNQATAANAEVTWQGMKAGGSASVSLAGWTVADSSPVSATLTAANLDLVHALEVAGFGNPPASGSVSFVARLSGTLGQPAGSADITFSKGLIYQQPYDSVTSHVQYLNAGLQTASGTFVSGPKRVTFEIAYPHPGQAFPAGTLRISALSNSMALNQIALIRQRQPDIQGAAQFRATATVRVSRGAKQELQFDLTSLDGDGSATGIGLGGRDLGDSHFTARTEGTTLTAGFDSNAARATIRGEAKVALSGDDHASGSITFTNAGLNATAALIVTEAEAKNLTFDGSAEGQVDFSGPLFNPAGMSVTATVRQIEVHPLPKTPLATVVPGFSLHNVGPVKVSYDKSVMRVDSARFQAPDTDMTVSGTADTGSAAPLNLRLQGNVSLAMLRNFVPDLAASGTMTVSGSLRGIWSAPDFSGHASIHDGQFHYADFTNGLAGATGEIVFSGSRATIQSFSGDTGGGKLTASGFATLNDGALSFQLSVRTRDVRLRYPQGVSSVSDSDIQMIRNAQRSSISGTITVKRLVFNPQQDTATMLADISHGARAPAASDTSLANMNLDVLIQTAPDVALQSKVAESIQADASMRLRGTVASPALLGRINVSQGEVLFFGNKYTISRGSISFFNPTRIDPVLDVDLQTRARGVDVTLTVTGPPSNLGMTYRSDPPLEFSDIVALLATGRTPDDPSVALRGNAPTPSFEQLGASALIGQTLANPVAGRLQRFFGVSRIKIDPQLSGVGGNPGARLTVEQQVTPDILFTYITDVSNTSEQLIRVEWAFNRNWSAILEREENGYVGLDFAYKKRLK